MNGTAALLRAFRSVKSDAGLCIEFNCDGIPVKGSRCEPHRIKNLEAFHRAKARKQRPKLFEQPAERPCPHCGGTGIERS